MASLKRKLTTARRVYHSQGFIKGNASVLRDKVAALTDSTLLPLMDSSLFRLPRGARQRLVKSLLAREGQESVLEQARALGIRGKWTREEPDAAGDGAELARTLGELWLGMKDRQRSVSPAYLPAPDWASVLDADWAGPREWLEAGDSTAFENFLRNFFRSGGISGLWGGNRMFEDFARADFREDVDRLATFMKQFEAWRREVPGGSLDDLDAVRVGNPWGYDVDGRLVVEPAFEYHHLALRVREIVADAEHPVVLEIGGGYGGLARQILRLVPGVRYVGLDLPENVIVQAWYLTRSLPDCRVNFGDADAANRPDLSATDALVLPNWALADLDLTRLDAVVNVHSFGEMNRSTLETYFAEITRLRPEWVYHDNLSAPRHDDLYGISSTEYPPLRGYRVVASCESRWPRYDHHSPYPCRENLFRLNESVSGP